MDQREGTPVPVTTLRNTGTGVLMVYYKELTDVLHLLFFPFMRGISRKRFILLI